MALAIILTAMLGVGAVVTLYGKWKFINYSEEEGLEMGIAGIFWIFFIFAAAIACIVLIIPTILAWLMVAHVI